MFLLQYLFIILTTIAICNALLVLPSPSLSPIIIILLCLIIARILIQDNSVTHIEKVIKNHNSIKDSWLNTKYPTILKPANSKTTVINGDSVRVMPKINKQINEDSLNNDPNIIDWFIDEGELYIYTKQDSINDEIERYNYIRSLDEEGWEE